jgi:hypothetical protein
MISVRGPEGMASCVDECSLSGHKSKAIELPSTALIERQIFVSERKERLTLYYNGQE